MEKDTFPLDEKVWREAVWKRISDLAEIVAELVERDNEKAQRDEAIRLKLDRIAQELTDTQDLND